uniref:Auxin-responsive protein n=1 Tax=Wollemia nobilis TaxID=56998 RepID=A0A0C9QNH9_9CONI
MDNSWASKRSVESGLSCCTEESSDSTISHQYSKMRTHDYIGISSEFSSYADPSFGNADGKLEETELTLGLCLPDSKPNGERGMDLGKEFNNERCVRSIKDGIGQQANGTRSKRVHSEAIGCGNGRERSLLSLQICEPSAENSSISPNSKSPAVGWPPVRSCRKISLSVSPKSRDKERSVQEEATSGNFETSSSNSSSFFVKVMMDGVPIMRKVDLNVHSNYKSLALAMEDMFRPYVISENAGKECQAARNSKHSWLLDDRSSYLLTYLDKEGDWMLVGDAPWRMFISSVKRIRIAKRSDANGVGLQANGFNRQDLLSRDGVSKSWGAEKMNYSV